MGYYDANDEVTDDGRLHDSMGIATARVVDRDAGRGAVGTTDFRLPGSYTP